MDHLTALKTLHISATVLFLLSALGLTIWLIKGRRAGFTTNHTRLLLRPRLFAWILMGLCLLTMPITGWWLAHLVGWPLGQTWVLGSSVLYTFGALSWLWLVVRLNKLRIDPARGGLKFTLALAIFTAVCFIAIAGLMGSKPV
ncbi:putative integral membrane protein [Pseudomonas savastanoi pv. glycinea]|nr:putative integral membrane protein [Pseudomonas savastanoi pv. glycinea]